jgi:hypothetical protein
MFTAQDRKESARSDQKIVSRLKWIGATLCVALLSITITTLASAQAGNDNTIHACVKGNGQLRIVQEGTSCRARETPLTWNIQGPSGLSTVRLEGGGISLAPGTQDEFGVFCLAEERLTGGGYEIQPTSATGVWITRNSPTLNDGGEQDSWGITAVNSSSETVNVIGYAICATP